MSSSMPLGYSSDRDRYASDRDRNGGARGADIITATSVNNLFDRSTTPSRSVHVSGGSDREPGASSEDAVRRLEDVVAKMRSTKPPSEGPIQQGSNRSMRKMGSTRSATMGRLSRSAELNRDLKYRFKKFVASSRFDAASGVIIVANAVTLGIEQEYGDPNGVIAVFEHFFLVCYSLELFCRWQAFRKEVLMSKWWWFDFVLVFTGVFTGWILPLFMGGNSGSDDVGVLMILRSTRLLRLARIFQASRKLRVLGLLVKGLLTSTKTIMYTLFMLFMVLYVASCISMEIITKHRLAIGDSPDPFFQRHVEANFHNLPQTMLTLVQFVTLDNMTLIYTPLVEKDWRLAGFFIFVILLVSIILTNLITGVIVNSAMEAAVEDREHVRQKEGLKRKKQVMEELRTLFKRIDVDGNGCLSWYEIESAQADDRNYLGELLTEEDPMDIFMALDTEKTGEVDIEEFCECVWQVAISGAPAEIRRVEKSVNVMQRQLQEMEEATEEMRDHLDTVKKMVHWQTESLHGNAFSAKSFSTLGDPSSMSEVIRQSGDEDSHEDSLWRPASMPRQVSPALSLLRGLSAASPIPESSISAVSASTEQERAPRWAIVMLQEMNQMRTEVRQLQGAGEANEYFGRTRRGSSPSPARMAKGPAPALVKQASDEEIREVLASTDEALANLLNCTRSLCKSVDQVAGRAARVPCNPNPPASQSLWERMRLAHSASNVSAAGGNGAAPRKMPVQSRSRVIFSLDEGMPRLNPAAHASSTSSCSSKQPDKADKLERRTSGSCLSVGKADGKRESHERPAQINSPRRITFAPPLEEDESPSREGGSGAPKPRQAPSPLIAKARSDAEDPGSKEAHAGAKQPPSNGRNPAPSIYDEESYAYGLAVNNCEPGNKSSMQHERL